MKKMKAGKYLKNIQSKAAYVASKPKDSTYKVDKTDEVFATLPTDSEDEQEQEPNKENGVANKRKKPTIFAAGFYSPIGYDAGLLPRWLVDRGSVCSSLCWIR